MKPSKQKHKKEPLLTKEDQDQLEQLEFVLKGRSTPTVILITCPSNKLRKKIQSELQFNLPEYNYQEIDVGGEQVISLYEYIKRKLSLSENADRTPQTIVSIYNLENSLYELHDDRLEFSPLMRNMNLQRELLFRELPIVTIIWTERHFLNKLGDQAKDLWDWVSYSFEFTGKDQEVYKPLPYDSAMDVPGKISKRQQRIDELLTKLDEIPVKDTDERLRRDRMLITRLLGEEYQLQRDFKLSLKYLKKSLSEAKELDEYRGQAHAFFILGALHLDFRKLEKALAYYKACIKIERNLDSYNFGNTYHEIGRVYQEQKNWSQALRYFQKATEWKTKLGKEDHLGRTYHHIGMVYQEQRKWNKAIEYFQKAIEWDTKTGQEQQLGSIYHQTGIIYQEQQKWNHALEFFLKAIEWDTKTGQGHKLGSTYHQVGIVYQEQKNWNKASEHFQKALELKAKAEQSYQLGSTYHQIGRVYEQQGQASKALVYYQKAKSIASEYNLENELPIIESSIQRIENSTRV